MAGSVFLSGFRNGDTNSQTRRLSHGSTANLLGSPLLAGLNAPTRGPPAGAPSPTPSSPSPAAPPRPFSPDASSPLLPMPAEFFHPAVSASQKGQEKGPGAGTLPKIALQGSWASLRSPSVNCSLLRQVWARPRLQELSCWGTSEWGLDVQVEMEGQVWGMGGLAYRAPCTALARAASWACRGHGAQSRKATQSQQPHAVGGVPGLREKQELPQFPPYGGSRAGPRASPTTGPSSVPGCVRGSEAAAGNRIQSLCLTAYSVLFSVCVAGV